MASETLLIGNNEIVDCDAALEIEGAEVFRLRDREHDGQLVVDFDLRDAAGNRIAKISKNHVVHVSEGFEVQSQPRLYRVIRKDTGDVYASVEEVSPRTLKLTGKFHANGLSVLIDDSKIVKGNTTISHNTIKGFDTAVELRRDSLAIGLKKAR